MATDPVFIAWVKRLDKVTPELWFDGDRTLQNKERPCVQKFEIKPGDEALGLDLLARIYPLTVSEQNG